MEDEQLPGTVSCLGGGKKRVLGGKFYFKGLRKVKSKYFLGAKHCIHLIKTHSNLVSSTDWETEAQGG